MLMIVATHICNAVGTSVFRIGSQFFTTDVQLFFMLSAYLYSVRPNKKFVGLLKRFIRIIILVCIFDFSGLCTWSVFRVNPFRL